MFDKIAKSGCSLMVECAAGGRAIGVRFSAPRLIQYMKNKKRCDWSEGNELMINYHDKEWGVPVHSDRKLFEFLLLEGAQAGLSWDTILKRRKGYRSAFENFNPKKIVKYDEKKIQKLLGDPGIIRNKLKVRGAVKNAQAFLRIQGEFGSFDKYIWGFIKEETIKNKHKEMSDIPAKSSESDEISKDMKKRGFTFFGTTICYAHMQATGMVNDHIISCFRYSEV